MKIEEYFGEIKHIHLVGIGGISMSAIAKLCLNFGLQVSGSDSKKSEITEQLKLLGVKIYYNHKKDNVKNSDLVVYTCAVSEDNEELISAKMLGIKILERADFLHIICKRYNHVIAISGTHGKTTTTAMIGNIFLQAGLNPTIHLGGECENFNGNLKIGNTDFFITEACEYKKHLLKLPHEVGVVLNMELDHVECYKNYTELNKTFNKFALDSTKLNVINEKFSSLFDKSNIITFSDSGNANFVSGEIKILRNGKTLFSCYKNGEFFGNFILGVLGKYNVTNALSAIAVADHYGIKYKEIYLGLESFKGIKRRFEYFGKINNQLVIHDYAHHPTEIENVINTTKEMFNKPVLVVFQPHTYSRTKYLFADFVSKLNIADNLVIVPTYPAREKRNQGYDAKKLFLTIKRLNKNAKYFYSFNKVKSYLERCKDYVILILGAGDVVELAKSIKSDYLLKN